MKRLRIRASQREGSSPYCSFCGKGQTARRNVIRRADRRNICDDCIDRVIDALAKDGVPGKDAR